jgi:plasmid stabilization system protein ParE
MRALFQLTTLAAEDLDRIWWFIATDSTDAADRVEEEIASTCRRLAGHPLIGHSRPDVTPLPVRFWTIPKYPSYVIVYRPETKPLQVIAIPHGKRHAENMLKSRLPGKSTPG